MNSNVRALHKLRMWISERSGVGGWQVNLETQQVTWTEETRKIHGVGPDFVPSVEEAINFYPEEARGTVTSAIEEALQTGSPWEFELPFNRACGTQIWVRAKGEAIFEDGVPRQLMGTFQDITHIVRRREELEQAQKAAQTAKERLWRAIEALPEAFVLYDTDDKVALFNTRYRALYAHSARAIKTGATFESILRYGLDNRQYPEAFGREEEWLEERLERHRNPVGQITQELPGDKHLQIHEVILPSGDTVGFRVDVTQLTRQQRELAEKAVALEEAAVTDPLTELGNRRALDMHVRSLRHTSVATDTFGLLHLDLDRFKPINDVFGHAAGDFILRQVAETLRRSVKHNDFIARVGGDEFVVVLGAPCNEEDASRVAQRIIKTCQQPLEWEGKPLLYGASVGISIGPASQLPAMINDADIALYEAKNSGRNRHFVFNADLRRRVEDKKRLSDDLFRAIEQKEIVGFYQPQFRASDHAFCGMEALARWEHPEEGTLSPGVFLPIADEVGLLSQIDKLVFEHAVETGMALAEQGTMCPKMAVNIDLKQLVQSKSEIWLPRKEDLPFSLAIEILETLDVDRDLELVSWAIDDLRERGLLIEVDDFGSGHASLTSLLKIKPDRVKLDLGLVHASRIDPQGAGKMVKSICNMCLDLGIKVTAEGIETELDADAMTDLGCDTLQGYMFSKPLSRSDLLVWSRTANISEAAPTPLLKRA